MPVRPSHSIRLRDRIQRSLADFSQRHQARIEARHFRTQYRKFQAAIRRGEIHNFIDARSALVELGLRFVAKKGNFGTREMVISNGKKLVFGPDGSYVPKVRRRRAAYSVATDNQMPLWQLAEEPGAYSGDANGSMAIKKVDNAAIFA